MNTPDLLSRPAAPPATGVPAAALDGAAHPRPPGTLGRSLAVIAVAAWSGFFVMAVELLGARMLAPNFGNSIYVWGGVITVFMVGLAIGYLLGGQYSMRRPSVARLAALQLLAAATVVPVVLYGGAVLDRLFDLIEDPRWGSIAGSAVIFLVPTIICGMISPYAVRLLVEDTRTSGRLSGLLFFFSTFGSAAGTLLTSFYLVLLFEIDQLLWSLIGISVVLSGGVLVLTRFSRSLA